MHKFRLFGLLIVIGFWSCGGGDGDGGAGTGPALPTKGDVKGSVNLYDESITQIDNSGMTIMANGVSSTTDANGDFTLKNVAFGELTINYEKSGFGTFKFFSLNHDSEITSIPTTPSLGQESTTEVVEVTTSISGTDIVISTTTDPDGNSNNKRYLRFFYNSDESVSNLNYSTHSETFEAGSNPLKHIITQKHLNEMGFVSGSTVYVRAYGESFWSNSYHDSSSNKTVFPNLNSTTVDAISFIVP